MSLIALRTSKTTVCIFNKYAVVPRKFTIYSPIYIEGGSSSDGRADPFEPFPTFGQLSIIPGGGSEHCRRLVLAEVEHPYVLPS